MSPWWGLRVWQKWIRAFVAWPALITARFHLPFFCLMLESSAALSTELGLSTSQRKETNMEKNPNSSTNSKVPPRSSSTGPAPGESKPKTGDKPPPCRIHVMYDLGWTRCVHTCACVARWGLAAAHGLFIWYGWRRCQSTLSLMQSELGTLHAAQYAYFKRINTFVYMDYHVCTDELLTRTNFICSVVLFLDYLCLCTFQSACVRPPLFARLSQE